MRLIDLFERGHTLSPDGICFSDGTAELTYRQVRLASRRVAARLGELGLGRDDVVAVYSHNHLLTFVAVLGILRAGSIWMPMNARNGRDEVEHVLAVHDTRFVFFHSGLAPTLEPALAKLDRLAGIACIDSPPGTPNALRDWLGGPDIDVPDVDLDMDDVVAIRSTGGTTGPSKGVMVTTRMFATLFGTMCACMPVTRTPVHLAAAPLSHASGTLCFSTMAFGGTNVVLPRADPQAILDAIERHRVTTMFLPPTLLYMLLDSPDAGKRDCSSLQYLIYAGAPMSVDRLRQALHMFGPVLVQGFGQAEAPFFCTCLTAQEHVVEPGAPAEQRLRSCGRATPFTRVEVMDDEGRILGAGEVGEIVVRGDIVMKGYWRNPEATRAVSRYGWHHTGDVGYRDPEGYFYIVDRKRDLIISGGFNIAPSEIEQVLWSHPAVADCAVIGVPDEKWGESVKAVVELKPAAHATEAELQALCRDRLGGMKAPRSVEFWPALPRSPVGKVLKREIRRKFWAGRDRSV